LNVSASIDLTSSKAREALRDADTVALVVHGVGDHTAVEILGEAVKGPASVWGAKATFSEVQIEDLPVPKEAGTLEFERTAPKALQVLMDSRKHMLLPIVWSGVRPRAARWANRGEGPQSLWNALPVLSIIGNRFRHLRFAILAIAQWRNCEFSCALEPLLPG
jgi:hypothetical protein